MNDTERIDFMEENDKCYCHLDKGIGWCSDIAGPFFETLREAIDHDRKE